ncbi:DUF3103 family protein [Streptomyces sp. NPDC060027]|uniref:DUF3103 family protein n=1 Tax=Streptomyces sp. NPDC060027 TaxID=3347040 RepID=UPI0036A25EAB
MRHHLRRRTAGIFITLSLLVLTAAPTAAALPATGTTPSRQPESAVAAAQERAARSLARSLSDSAWRTRVQRAAQKSAEVPVAAMARHADGTLRSDLASANRRIAAAKGLDGSVGPLLRLRLGVGSMREALTTGVVPWVAAATADDSSTVTAYDSHGRAHKLDARTPPKHPVYVVDIDGEEAVAAGLRVLRSELGRLGLASPTVAASSPGSQDPGFWATRLTEVRLSDDKETWIKGDAEIYTLVTGFGHDGKAKVDPVDMPYLDNEGTIYSPQQILVNWANYKYNLADAVMMEDDGGTNYRDLAKAIAGVLLTITDQGMYVPLANAVLDAFPDYWLTDGPDYVDSWYSLARHETGTRNGARGNGLMTLEPYFVQQF